MDNFKIQNAVSAIWNLIDVLDKYIQETQAFKIIKTDEKLGKELIKEYVARLFDIAKSLEPFLPVTAEKLQELILKNKKPESPLFLRKE